jgi:PAS domain S-box-containing protein
VNIVARYSKLSATLAGSLVGAMGALVLCGWFAGSEYIKSVVPGFVAMNPLTAACFVLAGISLWLQRDPSRRRSHTAIARVCALALVVVSILKMVDYALQLDLGIDRMMFAAELGDNRMAPNTAMCFALSGLSLLALDWVTARGFWPTYIPAALLAVLSSVSVVGYSYGASSMYRVSSYIPMALNTAVAFMALALGLLLSRPQHGMAKVLFSSSQGSMMARRLLLIGIVVPSILGWFRVWGQKLGWYETGFGAALMVAITAVIFTAAILGLAKKLNESDDQNQRAAAELARRSAEIRDLYDTAPCGYHSLDPDGMFISINQTELSWLGYEHDELVGKKKFADIIRPAALQHFMDSYARFKEAGYVKDLEFELVRKDGTTFPVILNATAIYGSDGRYLASRTTLFDATERKRVENAIRTFNVELESRVAERTELLRLSNAELTQKNQENEMFVYSVSHDLRSPLVNLQGFSQELESVSHEVRKIVAGPMPPDAVNQATRLIDQDVHRCIHFIQTSVGRLSGIIDALLRLSRAGRVEYDPRAVDLNQAVTRIIESMSATIYDCGVKIEVAPLPVAWGDPTALEQVFANLIGNAVNYLDPARQGIIEIGSVREHSDQTETTYFVKDNGLGIAEAYHGKVFQALKRLHPKVAGGEGIGLALIKRVVERHNGAIWFESAENAGATFYVRLPQPAAGKAALHSTLPRNELSDRHECNSNGHLIS